MSDLSDYSDDEDLQDSDIELQEAFARGELKPGLVVLEKTESTTAHDKPSSINDAPKLKSLLNQIKLPSTFSWVERLDIVGGLAPIAPEIAVQLDDHREKREREIKNANAKKVKKKKGVAIPPPSIKSIEEDPIHNDFQREMNFHRQAQQAILTCLPRLKSLGIPTKRPDDYFAEMAKSDTHMQKVAVVLQKQQVVTERADKVRKMREQKKYAKQTQVHVLQERQKAKKEMIESVKKYRKGQKNSLDFLDDKKPQGKRNNNSAPAGGGGYVNRKREIKNDKYGYGGRKKGSKWNTKESLDELPPKKTGRGFQGQSGRGRGGGGASGRGRGGGGGRGRGGGGGRGRDGDSGSKQFGGGRGRGSMNNSRGTGGFGGRGRGKTNRPGKTTRQKMKGKQ